MQECNKFVSVLFYVRGFDNAVRAHRLLKNNTVEESYKRLKQRRTRQNNLFILLEGKARESIYTKALTSL